MSAKTNLEINATYFAAVLNHYYHQNALIWTRVQTLVAIQTAALIGIYAVAGHWIVWAIGLLSVLLTVALRWILERDIQLRDVNEDLIQKLGAEFEFRDTALYLPSFKIGCPPKCPAPFKAVSIFRFIFISFIAIDVALVIGAYFFKDIIK